MIKNKCFIILNKSIPQLLLCTFFYALVLIPKVNAEKTHRLTWDDVPSVIQSIQEPIIPERAYFIDDFGATVGEKTDAGKAINAAIKEANKNGGGKVIVRSGTWFCEGTIYLLSNVELHLEKDATILFSANPEHYLPQVLTRWEGTELFNYSPFIYAYQAVNVAITGEGTLNGNAENTFGEWRDKQRKAQQRLRQMGADGIPVYERVFGEGDYLRPSMIQFFSCSNIKIEGVTITNSPFWVTHIISTHNAIIRNIKVDSRRLNNDGVDVESSSNVLIEDNHFITGDDAIVIKSGRDRDGWRLGRPSERIIIRNNYMEGHNALAIGSEMSGGVRDVFMENNQLGNVRGSLYFKSNMDRGGIVENIWIRNITVENSRRPLIQFRTNYHGLRTGGHPPLFRDITIENVTVEETGQLIYIHGIEEKPIENIKISNVHGKKSRLEEEELEYALMIDTKSTYITNLTLDNVTLSGRPVTQK